MNGSKEVAISATGVRDLIEAFIVSGWEQTMLMEESLVLMGSADGLPLYLPRVLLFAKQVGSLLGPLHSHGRVCNRNKPHTDNPRLGVDVIVNFDGHGHQ